MRRLLTTVFASMLMVAPTLVISPADAKASSRAVVIKRDAANDVSPLRSKYLDISKATLITQAERRGKLPRRSITVIVDTAATHANRDITRYVRFVSGDNNYTLDFSNFKTYKARLTYLSSVDQTFHEVTLPWARTRVDAGHGIMIVSIPARFVAGDIIKDFSAWTGDVVGGSFTGDSTTPVRRAIPIFK